VFQTIARADTPRINYYCMGGNPAVRLLQMFSPPRKLTRPSVGRAALSIRRSGARSRPEAFTLFQNFFQPATKFQLCFFLFLLPRDPQEFFAGTIGLSSATARVRCWSWVPRRCFPTLGRSVAIDAPWPESWITRDLSFAAIVTLVSVLGSVFSPSSYSVPVDRVKRTLKTAVLNIPECRWRPPCALHFTRPVLQTLSFVA